MDTLSLPTITADELADRASSFAQKLVEDLNNINKQYPQARLSEQEAELLKKQGKMKPDLSPEDYRRIFEYVFCLYMADQYAIVP